MLDESSSSSESEESSVNVTISQVTSASDTPEDSSSFAKCLEQKGQCQMQQVTVCHLACDEESLRYENSGSCHWMALLKWSEG